MYEFAIKKMKQEESKIKKWATKTFDEIQIGDIYVWTFGYDMTINIFFQVVGKRGKSTVDFREINSRLVSGDGYGYSTVEPIKDDFVTKDSSWYDKEFSSRYNPEYGSFTHGRMHLHEWDGRPMYENHMD